MSAVEAPAGIDKDVWNTMTDEERAGIAGTEYSEQELATITKLANQSGADSDDDEDDDDSGDDGDDKAGAQPQDGKGDGNGDAVQATAAAEEPAASAAEQATDTPAPAAAPVRYEAKLPEDFDAKVMALGEAETQAWKKFEDGDMDRPALQAELNRIATERSDLNGLKIKAEISQEMNAQTAEQAWQAAVNRSMAEFSKPENGGIDYRKDEAKAADWDQFIKVLANNPANADKPMEWFLSEAHKRVQALYGITPAKRETPAEANAKRKTDVAAAPKTLAHVPGSDGPGDIGSEFVDIDNLEGDELESAIARMTPAQRERFAQGR